MKNWGFVLIGAGALAAVIALLLMPSTVNTEQMTTLPYTGSVIGSGRFAETYNLARAQLRELIFQGGGVLFLGGCILLVGGVLDDHLHRIATLRFGDLAREPVSVTVAAEGDVATYAAPAYTPDLEEAERNKKIVAAVIVIAVVVLVVLGVVGATRHPRVSSNSHESQPNPSAAVALSQRS